MVIRPERGGQGEGFTVLESTAGSRSNVAKTTNLPASLPEPVPRHAIVEALIHFQYEPKASIAGMRLKNFGGAVHSCRFAILALAPYPNHAMPRPRLLSK